MTQPLRGTASRARILDVGLDDLAHQSVTHHVGIGQILKADTIDAGKDALDLHESRLFAPGKIDLSLVAGDDRFRVNTQARQKHLHLRGGRVLRLVQNYESVSQTASTHVREPRDPDRTSPRRLI